MVCMDNKGSIIANLDKKIGDVYVLTAKAITIREALKMSRDCIWTKLSSRVTRIS